MIGSPDLLPFTEGFEEEGEEQEAQRSLPEEFSVPLLPPAQPWSTEAQFRRDFILVAEFSEQVGPKPVLTIPDNQKVIGSFDLNHFSVRIMSVDYQASGPGHSTPASPGPRLNFSEDSKVILGDSAEDSFAYVHHLTLYDLEARGMVRPFCMAYVCSDQAKLMENFPELSAGFSQASDSLKTGNRQAFSTELRRKLQELEFSRLTLLQETGVHRSENDSSEAVKPGELEALELSVSNHRELLRQVTSYPNRKLKQPDFLPYDPADPLADLTGSQPPEPPSPSSSSSFSRSKHLLKPLEELCNSYFLSLMKEQLADTERRLRGDRSVLRTERVTRSLSRRLKLTNFLFELWSPGDAEEEEEDEEEETAAAAEGAEVVPESKKEAASGPQSVESFLSCVEEIPIKLEAAEGGTAPSEPCAAAEMTGSVSSGDSIEVLGTERSYRTQQVVYGSDGRETPVGTADGCVRHPAADPSARCVRVHARRANSEDSIEVLSTTESIFPDDLTAITEEEAEPQPLTNGFRSYGESLTGRGADEALKEERRRSVAASGREGGEPVDTEEPLKEIQVTERRNGLQEDATREKRLKAESRSVPRLHVNFAPPAVLPEVGRRSPPGPPSRLLSVDEASDCTSFSGSSNPPSPTHHVYTHTSNERIRRRRRRRKAGLRALRFIKQHSFSQHAVFCLLSGRPLVVVGGDEALVMKLVDALSLFVPAPGPDGSAVMPCLTTPLQLTDLLTWKLIGIHRSSITSSTVLHSLTQYSRYLALLDLDQRTLKCPPYSGSLINALADPHAGFTRGSTYLLHLESCLTALANRVLLHAFLPALRPAPAGEHDPLHAQRFRSSESDLRVLHFLSDLVKQQHTGRGPLFLRFSYSSSVLHRNTYAT
ncbi:guanine nucleotide exchange protein smcr8b [Kryptolebias marmoratus]|uniref:Guanine nucleotide exchange protein SMCR8-like n=1 Tax=Kryptolebias marmoratus TaxID=37003 RepID=A0A3Q3A594_KRYMA|nr:guanine nucleotide exchange protein smcr8b [Kryptolebias marmoratus]XP_037830598.1 guanine nucleotide exchange protein smcr8b [Kryptolebias marmoratus]